MSAYKTFTLRIKKAKDICAVNRLFKSLDRLYEAGIFSANEFKRLDLIIMEKLIKLEQ